LIEEEVRTKIKRKAEKRREGKRRVMENPKERLRKKTENKFDKFDAM
jgi:hypothetical protein